MSSRRGSKRDFERVSTAGERKGERINTGRGGGGAGEGGDRFKSEVNKVKRQDSSVQREENCCRNGWTHTHKTPRVRFCINMERIMKMLAASFDAQQLIINSVRLTLQATETTHRYLRIKCK